MAKITLTKLPYSSDPKTYFDKVHQKLESLVLPSAVNRTGRNILFEELNTWAINTPVSIPSSGSIQELRNLFNFYIANKYKFDENSVVSKVRLYSSYALKNNRKVGESHFGYVFDFLKPNMAKAKKFAKVLNRYIYLINKTLISKKIPIIISGSIRTSKKTTESPEILVNVQLNLRRISPSFQLIQNFEVANKELYRKTIAAFSIEQYIHELIASFSQHKKRADIYIDETSDNSSSFGVSLHYPDLNVPCLHKVAIAVVAPDNDVYLDNRPLDASLTVLFKEIILKSERWEKMLDGDLLIKIINLAKAIDWNGHKLKYDAQIVLNLLDNLFKRNLNGSIESSAVID